MQIVEIELDPGEAVQAEAGAMAYMGPGIQMQTSMGSEGGGLLGGAPLGQSVRRYGDLALLLTTASVVMIVSCQAEKNYLKWQT